MYACVHVTEGANATTELMDLALEFSPAVEAVSEDTVVFSITPLRKLIGSPHQIASEICRSGFHRKLQAQLAIGANPDTAILLARNFAGVMLVTPGEEHLKLAPIPLEALFAHHAGTDPALFEVLLRWGLKTCGDLAALPERGIAERLGQPGVHLWRLARGAVNRPLRLPGDTANYERRMDLEHPVSLIEPLLFLLGSVLSELCTRLRSQSRAARILQTRFELSQGNVHECELEFPVPLEESKAILKILQLHLERHPPPAAVAAFTLRIQPIEPRRIQRGLFLPPTPLPDKLQLTLARIAGLVGKDNVGTPVLLNTHRPDAFQLSMLPSEQYPPQTMTTAADEHEQTLRLAIRLFRPALHATVTLKGMAPQHVIATGVKGKVLRCAGPWKTSGDWWTSTAWTREEWDVALNDGALYRIYRDMQTREWYVHGVYD